MGERTTSGELASVCRLILLLRLFSLLITVFSLPQASNRLLSLFIAVVAGGLASFVPLRWWDRLAPTLMRHPAYLAGDLVLGMGLLAVTGVDSPFFYFTLGTAALSGLLYRWPGAAVFSVLLLLAYWTALRAGPAEQVVLTVVIGNPILYPLAAAAGAGLRRIIESHREMEAALVATSQRAAVEGERSRIARDMHDSLAKTMHGMSLSASALSAWVHKDPDRAAADAEALADAARKAAGETRSIIGDLRQDAPDVPLDEAIVSYVDEWSERTGVAATVQTGRVDSASPATRWELFCVLREALANVEQHAGAEAVVVTLAESGQDLVLEIEDDGVGFEARNEGSEAGGPGGGHYGLVGMAERAERVGGSLTVRAVPWEGAMIAVTVPRQSRLAEARETV